jgi:hypothetical protein
MRTQEQNYITLEELQGATSELQGEAEALGLSVDTYLSLLDLGGVTY